MQDTYNDFAEYNQQDATFHTFFISVRRSTCFRQVFRPSSGAQNCTYSVRHLSDQYCYLLLAWLTAGSSIGPTNAWRCMCSFELLMTDWKTCLKHVERLTEIKKLWNVASCWLYSANILAMHGPMNVKLTVTLTRKPAVTLPASRTQLACLSTHGHGHS